MQKTVKHKAKSLVEQLSTNFVNVL